jgi:hypothetical protein
MTTADKSFENANSMEMRTTREATSCLANRWFPNVLCYKVKIPRDENNT